MRARLGWWLRCAADRIDPAHAFRHTQLRMGYVEGVGLVVGDRRAMHPTVGAPLYSRSASAEYLGAHDPEVVNMGWVHVPLGR